MRLKVEDEAAQNVKTVKVDGKIIATCVEFDTNEGWAVALVPDLPAKRHIYEEGDGVEVVEDTSSEDSPATFGWIKVKYTGNIEVIFNDS